MRFAVPKYDLTGQVFGRLTVVEQAPTPEGKMGAFWLCRCECGTEKVVRSDALRQKKQVSCGCFQKENVTRYSTKWGGSVARNCLVSNYKGGARERGLSFDLTHEECEVLFAQDCYYCGAPPSQVLRAGTKRQHSITYNGLDRIDNTVGYQSDNVISCCKTCNSAKGQLTMSEFRDWIARVSQFLEKPNPAP